MAVSKAFAAQVCELLAPLGPIAVKAMFGGGGVYCRGVMMALIADDTLYLKADAASQAAFVAEGEAAFSYDTKDGRRTITSYWRMPDRLLDEPDELLAWARTALAVAEAASLQASQRRTGRDRPPRKRSSSPRRRP